MKYLTSLAGVSLFISGLASLVTLPAQAESPYSFYRVSGHPEVYLIDDHIWHIDLDRLPKPPRPTPTVCHVQNSSQMERFGGFGQVKEVRDKSFMRGRVYQGECKWPNGFYRRASQPEVYGLNDTQMCWVISPEMMEAYGGYGRVMVVDDSSDLLAGRKDGGRCKWPKR